MSLCSAFTRNPVDIGVDIAAVLLGAILIRTALEVNGTVPFWFTWEGAFRHSSDAIFLGGFGAFFIATAIVGALLTVRAEC